MGKLYSVVNKEEQEEKWDQQLLEKINNYTQTTRRLLLKHSWVAFE